MPRPTQIQDQQILDAAREVFLEKGIHATTSEVARRAHVGEGSIFKRYKTKAELFIKAMEHQVTAPFWMRALSANLGKREPREALVEAGLEAIEALRRIVPLMMMSWSNQATVGGLPSLLDSPDPPPVRAVRMVTGYFEAEIRAGRLRRHDPELLARVFVGSLHNYVFFEILLQRLQQVLQPPEKFVKGLVDLLWNGIAPEKAPPSRNRRTKGVRK
jgi:AcrR family transcriptional regulator